MSTLCVRARTCVCLFKLLTYPPTRLARYLVCCDEIPYFVAIQEKGVKFWVLSIYTANVYILLKRANENCFKHSAIHKLRHGNYFIYRRNRLPRWRLPRWETPMKKFSGDSAGYRAPNIKHIWLFNMPG